MAQRLLQASLVSKRSPSGNGRSALLEGVRQALVLRHYSPKTVEAYAGWVRRFVLFHQKRHRVSSVPPRYQSSYRIWFRARA